jgi:flagellar biosynthetic protein FliR
MPADLFALAYPYLLPAARVLGLLAFMPGFSANSVPPVVRVGLAAGTSALMVSAAGPRPRSPGSPGELILSLCAELALGLVIGWLVTILVEAARWAGETIDLQIGLGAASMFDPMTPHGASLLGQTYYLAAVTFFFTVDGHHWILLALGDSLDSLPPGALLDGQPLVLLVLGALASALSLTIRVAAAGTAAMLLADVGLAVIGRNVPQMNVFMVGMPAKFALGIIVLAMTAPLLGGPLGAMVGQTRHFVALLLGG